MKQCSLCGSTFPDAHQFCQYDRNALIAVRPAEIIAHQSAGVGTQVPAQAYSPFPAASAHSTAQSVAVPSCHRCGAVITDRTQFCRNCGTATAAAPQSAPLMEVDLELARLQNSRRTVLIVLAVVVVGLLGAFVIYKSRPNPLETKLEDAIANGNLLTPPGANAYELYHQLKLEGAAPETLSRFESKLRPLITARPYQLLKDFSVAGSKDPLPNEWEEAYKSLSWAQELSGGDAALSAKVAYCRGRIAYLTNRKDEAVEAWSQSGDFDKSWALPLNGVGLIYNERKDYFTARRFLQEAINRDPNWAVPYNNMGTSYFYERNYDQAEYYYREAVNRAANWGRPHAWLGAIAMQRKDYWSAVREFEIVLDSSTIGKENIDLQRISQQLEQARRLSMEGGY